MNRESTNPASPRWLHALAVLTVLFALPLVFLGAGVTTHGVGMVEPQGFRPPWEILDGLIQNTGLEWRLEYGHRTFGFLVGLSAIALALGCWFFDRRAWVGWLAIGALTLICMQGVLGIYRVNWDNTHGRTLKLIHGVFAQIVFATLVSVALVTSRRWNSHAETMSPALQRWSIITMLIVFLQLLLGGIVRHQESLLGPRGHLLGAFLVVGAVLWLLKLMRDCDASAFRVQRILLMGLLALQLWLGVESWLARFYVPTADLPQLAPAPMHAEWLRTLHYLVGTLIFSTTVAVVLVAHRKPAIVTEATAAPSHKLEGAL